MIDAMGEKGRTVVRNTVFSDFCRRSGSGPCSHVGGFLASAVITFSSRTC